MASKKNLGILKKTENYLRFSKYFKHLFSFCTDVYDKINEPLNIEQIESYNLLSDEVRARIPQPVRLKSRYDMGMSFLFNIIANGCLWWCICSLLFLSVLPLYWLFAFGLLRFALYDSLKLFVYEPAERVAKSFRFK
jgi:hypothetical protein